MAARRSRARIKGRYERGEYFATIPVDILESLAYKSIPDYAVRVLVALAGSYSGSNNGDLSLPRAIAMKRGVSGAWMVSAGLEVLRQTGLIDQTREGRSYEGNYLCALFALGWKEIDPTPHAYPEILGKRPAPNRWASWTRPDDWAKFLKDLSRRMRGEKRKWGEHNFSSSPDVGSAADPDVGSKNGQNPTRRRVQNRPATRTRRHGHLLESPQR